MEKEVFYSGLSQGISAVKVSTRGIEEILRFSNYNPLGRQVNELEDPPETLHSPWGLWLHHRDALHRVEQRHDTEHVLRAARAADDILHYANYVPKIGKHEHKIESFEINLEYHYSHEELIYNVNLELEGEDVENIETTINLSLEEESDNSDNKHEELENNEGENLSVDRNSKDSFSPKFKKDLIQILKTSE